MLFSYSLMSTNMHAKYMYVKYIMYSLLGWLDRCTSMGKGMGPCLYIAHVYLDRIVPRFGFYVYEGWIYEHVMNMMFMIWWGMNVNSVLVGMWKDCSYSYAYRLMHWYMNMCDIMCYVKGFLTSIYTLPHMNDDLVNGGLFIGVS